MEFVSKFHIDWVVVAVVDWGKPVVDWLRKGSCWLTEESQLLTDWGKAVVDWLRKGSCLLKERQLLSDWGKAVVDWLTVKRQLLTDWLRKGSCRLTDWGKAVVDWLTEERQLLTDWLRKSSCWLTEERQLLTDWLRKGSCWMTVDWVGQTDTRCSRCSRGNRCHERCVLRWPGERRQRPWRETDRLSHVTGLHIRSRPLSATRQTCIFKNYLIGLNLTENFESSNS